MDNHREVEHAQPKLSYTMSDMTDREAGIGGVLEVRVHKDDEGLFDDIANTDEANGNSKPYNRFQAFVAKYGVEGRGLERVLEDQRTDERVSKIANMVSCGDAFVHNRPFCGGIEYTDSVMRFSSGFRRICQFPHSLWEALQSLSSDLGSWTRRLSLCSSISWHLFHLRSLPRSDRNLG